jgi:hypothetical protein
VRFLLKALKTRKAMPLCKMLTRLKVLFLNRFCKYNEGINNVIQIMRFEVTPL